MSTRTEKILELADLLKSGIITRDEYDSMKKEVFEKIKPKEVSSVKNPPNARSQKRNIEKREAIKRRNNRISFIFLGFCVVVFMLFKAYYGPKNDNNNVESENYTLETIDSESTENTENNYVESENSSTEDQDMYAGEKCGHCSMGRYDSDGICTICDAASPSRVNESYSKHSTPCGGCNATGWRGDEICPLCDGKGSYMPY